MRVAHVAQLTEEEEHLVQSAGATGRWPAKSTQQDKQTSRHDLPLADLCRHSEEAVPPIGPHLHRIPSWSVAVVDPPRSEHMTLVSQLPEESE